MAYQLTTGWNDTPISGGATTLPITIPAINWVSDWIRQTNSSTGESKTTSVFLTNSSSPISREERTNFKRELVDGLYLDANYRKKDPWYIDPTLRFPAGQRVKLYSKVYEKWLVESGTTDVMYYVPASASISLELPYTEFLTPQIALDLLLRAVAMWFNVGDTTSSRIGSMIRGDVVPSLDVSNS